MLKAAAETRTSSVDPAKKSFLHELLEANVPAHTFAATRMFSDFDHKMAGWIARVPFHRFSSKPTGCIDKQLRGNCFVCFL